MPGTTRRRFSSKDLTSLPNGARWKIIFKPKCIGEVQAWLDFLDDDSIDYMWNKNKVYKRVLELRRSIGIQSRI